jgi:hypothetical protein
MAATITTPRATTHQDRIETAVLALVNLPVEVIEATEMGGSRALEKLLRCYHYWAVEYPRRGPAPTMIRGAGTFG